MIGDQSTKPPRVLVVEDEQVIAMDLEVSLRHLGYEVVGIAADGTEALQVADEMRPDVLLMDIGLPGERDGITIAEEIRRRWQLPVVFLTANANEYTLNRARAAGPYGYLLKPFRPEELNATIVLALSQHQAARELFTEHTWIRTLIDSMNDGVIATNLEGRVRYLNPAAERLTGWTSAEATGRSIEEIYVLFNMRGEPVQQCQLRMALEARRSAAKARFQLRSRAGRLVPIEDTVAMIETGGGPLGAATVFGDITEQMLRERLLEEERDRLEEEIQNTTEALGQTRAELRALSGHLMIAQEEEGRRLARELHDDFGQRTAILEMDAVRALERIREHPSEVEGLLRGIREQAAKLDQGLRAVSHTLHPSIIEDLGIKAALRSLVDSFRESGLDVSMRVPESTPTVKLDVGTTLYRVAQEALRNAAKHAKGAPVHVTLTVADKAMQLTIDDAGPGFDILQAKSNGGLGLLTMQERARLVGGTLLLRTKPGDGTTVTVRVSTEVNASTG